MSSNINVTNIDTTYPVSGQDNDSQGFRDNFTNINTNFTEAKAEIEALQVTALSTVIDHGGVGDPTTIDVSAAAYQKMTLSTESINLAFTNFTVGGTHSTVQLEINITNVAYTMTFPAEVTIGLPGIQGLVGSVVTFPGNQIYIFEFSSADAGATISVTDLTPVASVSSADVTYETLDANGDVGTTAGTLAIGNHDHSGVYLENISADPAPQLGGDLDVLARIITTTTVDGDIAITPDGTGSIVLSGLNWPQADGTAGYILKTDGAGQLSWADVASALEPTATYGTTGAVSLDTTANSYFYPTGTTTGVITFTFTNPASSGNVTAFTMELLGAGDNDPVWPVSVVWPAATEPTWTAAGTDVVSFITRDGGTTWLGMLGGLAFA